MFNTLAYTISYSPNFDNVVKWNSNHGYIISYLVIVGIISAIIIWLKGFKTK